MTVGSSSTFEPTSIRTSYRVIGWPYPSASSRLTRRMSCAVRSSSQSGAGVFGGTGFVERKRRSDHAPQPSEFDERAKEDLPETELLLVCGTSLEVSPANGVVRRVRRGCPRVLLNRERVGEDLGLLTDEERDDVFDGRNCDDSLAELAAHAGWLEDLAALRPRMCKASAEAVTAAVRRWLGRDDGFVEGGGKASKATAKKPTTAITKKKAGSKRR